MCVGAAWRWRLHALERPYLCPPSPVPSPSSFSFLSAPRSLEPRRKKNAKEKAVAETAEPEKPRKNKRTAEESVVLTEPVSVEPASASTKSKKRKSPTVEDAQPVPSSSKRFVSNADHPREQQSGSQQSRSPSVEAAAPSVVTQDVGKKKKAVSFDSIEPSVAKKAKKKKKLAETGATAMSTWEEQLPAVSNSNPPTPTNKEAPANANIEAMHVVEVANGVEKLTNGPAQERRSVKGRKSIEPSNPSPQAASTSTAVTPKPSQKPEAVKGGKQKSNEGSAGHDTPAPSTKSPQEDSTTAARKTGKCHTFTVLFVQVPSI